jgi:hypothetical protein
VRSKTWTVLGVVLVLIGRWGCGTADRTSGKRTKQCGDTQGLIEISVDGVECESIATHLVRRGRTLARERSRARPDRQFVYRMREPSMPLLLVQLHIRTVLWTVDAHWGSID